LKRIALTILASLCAVPAVHAEGEKTVTQQLIDKDAQVAVQKLDQELAKTNPVPITVAPVPSVTRGGSGKPKTVALFGVDGSAAGLPVTLRSYVQWGEHVYKAKVGGTVREYKVVSITAAGTKLAKGKQIVMAERLEDDAVLDVPGTSETASSSRHAGPMPAAPTGPGTVPSAPIMPNPGMPSVPMQPALAPMPPAMQGMPPMVAPSPAVARG